MRELIFSRMGLGVTLTFLQWGPTFKLHRKLLQQSFTPTACKSYRSMQEKEAKLACRQILLQPAEWELIARRFSSAVVLRIGFGVEISDNNDQYIQMAIEAESATGNGGTPAGSIVDFFPLLRHLPNSLALGDPFKPLKHARDSKFAIQRLHDSPWAATEPSSK